MGDETTEESCTPTRMRVRSSRTIQSTGAHATQANGQMSKAGQDRTSKLPQPIATAAFPMRGVVSIR